ncbi:hypothetical protein CP982_36740 [Streptomyces spectabilis]|uniref:Uncharacterized protein n=2 Tax=Streptomyces spectabilis TaxID=68270 RepID=A0A5P2XKM9_STRST|nr:hypothetical protein CP982_36740 [Streptomyces spectabilis]
MLPPRAGPERAVFPNILSARSCREGLSAVPACLETVRPALAIGRRTGGGRTADEVMVGDLRSLAGEPEAAGARLAADGEEGRKRILIELTEEQREALRAQLELYGDEASELVLLAGGTELGTFGVRARPRPY